MEEEAPVAGQNTADRPYSTEAYVNKGIRRWILDNENIYLKLFPNAAKHIELERGFELSSLETSCLEGHYVKIVLEMGLRETFREMFDYLENSTVDISEDLPTLLSELNLIHSFRDIATKLAAQGSLLRNWCDGGCMYLQLIV